MNIFADDLGDTWKPDCNPSTKVFFEEYIKLCEKHGMAFVPTYENTISFHDEVMIVPYSLLPLTDYKKLFSIPENIYKIEEEND